MQTDCVRFATQLSTLFLLHMLTSSSSPAHPLQPTDEPDSCERRPYSDRLRALCRPALHPLPPQRPRPGRQRRDVWLHLSHDSYKHQRLRHAGKHAGRGGPAVAPVVQVWGKRGVVWCHVCLGIGVIGKVAITATTAKFCFRLCPPFIHSVCPALHPLHNYTTANPFTGGDMAFPDAYSPLHPLCLPCPILQPPHHLCPGRVLCPTLRGHHVCQP